MSKFRHSCDGEDGCYLKKYKAPIEDFDEDLPRNCQYSDIDGFTECDRHYLIIEFKLAVGDRMESHWEKYPYRKVDGQLLAFENVSRDLARSTVWLVEGDSPNRHCSRMRELVDGVWTDWVAVDWLTLKQKHRDWFDASKLRERERLNKKYGRAANENSQWARRVDAA